jgi:hypothetical protein
LIPAMPKPVHRQGPFIVIDRKSEIIKGLIGQA